MSPLRKNSAGADLGWVPPKRDVTTRKARAPKSLTYKTLAAAEQAEALDFLERLRGGYEGAYGRWLIDQYMPKGINVYPAQDQVACATRIKAAIDSYHATGKARAGFDVEQGTYHPPTAAEADKDLDLLCGPETHRRSA